MLVFQYGSNTSSERLNARERLDSSARDLGLARSVMPHKLRFTHFSEGNQCGAADLLQDERAGRLIVGVAFDVPRHRIFRPECRAGEKTLDEIEGEGSAYRRAEIEITLADGTQRTAITYFVLNPRTNCPTHPS